MVLDSSHRECRTSVALITVWVVACVLALPVASASSVAFTSCPATTNVYRENGTAQVLVPPLLNTTHIVAMAYYSPEFSTESLTFSWSSTFNASAPDGVIGVPVNGTPGMWRISIFLVVPSTGAVPTDANCTFNNMYLPPIVATPSGGTVTMGTTIRHSFQSAAVLFLSLFNCTSVFALNSMQVTSTTGDLVLEFPGSYRVTAEIQCLLHTGTESIHLALSSPVMESTYTVPERVPTPTPSVLPTLFIDSVTVSLSTTIEGATIMYFIAEGITSLDIRPPLEKWTTFNPLYPIELRTTAVILTLAYATDMQESEVSSWAYVQREGMPGWMYTLGTVLLSIAFPIYGLYAIVRAAVGKPVSEVVESVLPAISALAEIGSFITDIAFLAEGLFQDEAITLGYQLPYIFSCILALLCLAQKALWASQRRPKYQRFFYPLVNVFAFVGASSEELATLEEERSLWAGLIRIVHDVPTLIVVALYSQEYSYMTTRASVFKLFWCIGNIAFSIQSILWVIARAPRFFMQCCNPDDEDEEAPSTDAKTAAILEQLRAQQAQQQQQQLQPQPQQEGEGALHVVPSTTESDFQRGSTQPSVDEQQQGQLAYVNEGSDAPLSTPPLVISGEDRRLLADVMCAAEIHLLKQLKDERLPSEERATLAKQAEFLQRESFQVEDTSGPPSPLACKMLEIDNDVHPGGPETPPTMQLESAGKETTVGGTTAEPFAGENEGKGVQRHPSPFRAPGKQPPRGALPSSGSTPRLTPGELHLHPAMMGPHHPRFPPQHRTPGEQSTASSAGPPFHHLQGRTPSPRRQAQQTPQSGHIAVHPPPPVGSADVSPAQQGLGLPVVVGHPAPPRALGEPSPTDEREPHGLMSTQPFPTTYEGPHPPNTGVVPSSTREQEQHSEGQVESQQQPSPIRQQAPPQSQPLGAPTTVAPPSSAPLPFATPKQHPGSPQQAQFHLQAAPSPHGPLVRTGQQSPSHQQLAGFAHRGPGHPPTRPVPAPLALPSDHGSPIPPQESSDEPVVGVQEVLRVPVSEVGPSSAAVSPRRSAVSPQQPAPPMRGGFGGPGYKRMGPKQPHPASGKQPMVLRPQQQQQPTPAGAGMQPAVNIGSSAPRAIGGTPIQRTPNQRRPPGVAPVTNPEGPLAADPFASGDLSDLV